MSASREGLNAEFAAKLTLFEKKLAKNGIKVRYYFGVILCLFSSLSLGCYGEVRIMSVIKQIADLQNLSHYELVSLWRTLCGNEPPATNRRFIIKRLAYRIQEIAYGGLSEESDRKMDAVLKCHGYDDLGMPKVSSSRAQSRKDLPVIGSKLVREWNGRHYEVTTLRDGFEYEGRRYRSLSAIAKAITRHTLERARIFWPCGEKF